MSKIKVLPVHLVNKIAAGECIERPASVLKELVENSIDAGATRIDVFLEQGGCKLIRVVDNGGGIDPEDISLTVTPHATSKLADEDALWSISTMGFRGEALASIGSVAQLKISSVVPGNDSGQTIEVDGGQISQKTPCAGSPGTTIEVHNLFFNTPARRKFLKTTATELNHCQEHLIRLALAYPNVAFSLMHGNRQLLQLSATDSPRQRISDIFNPQLADGLIQVFTQTKNITFTAYLSRPSQAKSSANWQYFFINKRAIRDRFITHALREAYRGLMPPDRQPVGFLFLEIEPSIVDVNVHPTKSEVRFADSGLIHSLVLGAIRERFLSTDLTAELSLAQSTQSADSPAGTQPENTAEHQQKIKEAMKDFFRTNSQSTQSKIKFFPPKSQNSHPYGESTHYNNTPPSPSATPKPADEPIKSAFPPITDSPSEPLPQKSPSDEVLPPSSTATPYLQIHNSYLVVETPDGLMIVDQHAMHERVLYEQLKSRVNSGPVLKQKLLMPDLINLTPAQMAHVEQIKSSLDQAGIEVEPFGPQTLPFIPCRQSSPSLTPPNSSTTS
ncbi:MAG: DNA mismatch repair endonuclease MutL [Phycisphaerae bacterium]|nr:DNA mismatch repair endonuclease MutL [Phycisphaerae bacterium]